VHRTRFSLLVCMLLVVATLGANTVSSVYDELDRYSDLRSLAMGSAGVALFDSGNAFTKNPAALHRTETTQFQVGFRYGDRIGGQGEDSIAWIQQPSAAFDMLFSNRFVALTIGLRNVLNEQEPPLGGPVYTDREVYTANNLSRIQLTTSYGWEAISLGLFARGGTLTEREVTIRDSRPLLDYFSRTYLERYEPSGDGSQLFASGIGLLLNYHWISLGFLTNSLFTIDEQSNQLVLDLSDVFDNSAIGIAVTTPKFDRNNELNRLVAIAAFDIADIGNAEQRSVRMGLEGKVQFLSDFWVALRAGYREVRPFGEALFTFSGEGEITTGIGGLLGDFGMEAVVIIPLDERQVMISAGLNWQL